MPLDTNNTCEICGVEINSLEKICDACESFLISIEKNHENELVYLRKQLKKLKIQNKQLAKERDILIHRILQLDHSYCPQSLKEMADIPKTHPEIIEHCNNVENCHACWYDWVKKEAEECEKKLCMHCEHKCTVNQNL